MVMQIINARRKQMGAKGKKGASQWNNPSEDGYICFILIFIISALAFIMVYSQQNAQEKYLKSSYYHQTNNIMYEIQSYNGTALLVTFRPKMMKRQNVSKALNDTFTIARNRSKQHNIVWEIKKETKHDVLLSVSLSNQTGVFDKVFKDSFNSFIQQLKKQKKIHAIEFRHFTSNPRQTAHFMTGSATKARDTFDYKIKFKQGEYTFIEPSKILEDKTTDLITPEEDQIPKQPDTNMPFDDDLVSDEVQDNNEEIYGEEDDGQDGIFDQHNTIEKNSYYALGDSLTSPSMQKLQEQDKQNYNGYKLQSFSENEQFRQIYSININQCSLMEAETNQLPNKPGLYIL